MEPALGISLTTQIDGGARYRQYLTVFAREPPHKGGSNHPLMARYPHSFAGKWKDHLTRHCGVAPWLRSPKSSRTISRQRSSTLFSCRHPSLRCALAGSPIRRSTSVGLKYRGSISTSMRPVFASRPFFLHTLPLPRELDIDLIEGAFQEITHRMGLASRQDVVIRLLLLQHQPHPPARIPGLPNRALPRGFQDTGDPEIHDVWPQRRG